MKYREIGSTGVEVSEISLGCWTMGGLNWVEGKPNGWANVDEDEITAAARRAVDAGVNHFDNADVYGNGRAERMLARALKRLGLKSTDFIIATKVGHFIGTASHAYEPRHIRSQCEQSLANLGRDYLDIYYFHHGDFGDFLEDAAAVMDDLVREGKVRVKGQSAYSEDDFLRVVPVVRPDVLQSWGNALAHPFLRPGSAVAGLLEKLGLSFVAFGPLAQGRLLDKFDPENPPAFEEGDHRRGSDRFTRTHLLEVREKMRVVKERFGVETSTLASVAQRFILNFPHVACVIPGFRNERQVACNVAAADFALSEADMAFLRGVFGADPAKK